MHTGLILQGENMDGTTLGQGTFTVPSTIVNQVIQIPSAADWVRVVNYTRQGTVGGSSAFGFEYYWQRGMANGSAAVKYYANSGAVVTGDTIPTGGFTLFDSSGSTIGSQALVGNPVATTASTNATRPVVSTASTAGISVGTVVRLSNTAQTDVNGIDFVVGAVTANTSFTLLAASNALATAPGAIGGAGFYRIVNAQSLYYPRRRTVTNITQSASSATVSTSLEHSLTVGQAVRFNVPSVSGMVQLNPTSKNAYLYATVTSITDTYNFVIDTDTSSFTAFTYPTIGQQPSSFPTVEPIGENTAIALAANSNVFPQYQGLNVYNANSGVFADATVNTGFIGMILGTGGTGAISTAAITGPAGSVAGDVVYWVSGKADFGGL